MLVLLSPAKSLDMSESDVKDYTLPQFTAQYKALIKEAQKMSVKKIQALMGVSEKIAVLNKERFAEFSSVHTLKNAKQALLAFNGDVYRSMERSEFSDKDLEFSQKTIRILSGLYGILKPLDLIQPYRLEMGISFKTEKSRNLYEFWSEFLTKQIVKDAQQSKSKAIINLASQEYSKVLHFDDIDTPVYQIGFKNERNGAYKTIGILAKRARGMMASFIIKNKCKKPIDLLDFNQAGYKFSKKGSTERNFVFLSKK